MSYKAKDASYCSLSHLELGVDGKWFCFTFKGFYITSLFAQGSVLCYIIIHVFYVFTQAVK